MFTPQQYRQLPNLAVMVSGLSDKASRPDPANKSALATGHMRPINRAIKGRALLAANKIFTLSRHAPSTLMILDAARQLLLQGLLHHKCSQCSKV
jgi:hypothetical protein